MNDDLDEQTRQEIASGQPMVIAYFDKDHNITRTEEYNMQNFKPQQWQIDALARALLPRVREFFSHPENEARFQAWKAEREKTKAEQAKQERSASQKENS